MNCCRYCSLFSLSPLSFRWTCPVVVPTSAVQIVYMYVPLVYAMAGQLYTCSSTSPVIAFAHLSPPLFVIAHQEKHIHNTDLSTVESNTHTHQVTRVQPNLRLISIERQSPVLSLGLIPMHIRTFSLDFFLLQHYHFLCYGEMIVLSDRDLLRRAVR
jgi:hypothetical protein